MNLSIFGLGYVGAVSLACLARDGHHVIGVDIDRSKLDAIAAGRTPVVEEGMVDLVKSVAASGRVHVTTDVSEAIGASELSLISHGARLSFASFLSDHEREDFAEALASALAAAKIPAARG